MCTSPSGWGQASASAICRFALILQHPLVVGLLLVDVLSDLLAYDPGQTPALCMTVQYAFDLWIRWSPLNSEG